MLPVNEVSAPRVSPVGAVPPVCAIRVELVEDMVVAPVQQWAVHVVHPTGRRAEMIYRARRICVRLRRPCHHRLHARPYQRVLILHVWLRLQEMPAARTTIRYHATIRPYNELRRGGSREEGHVQRLRGATYRPRRIQAYLHLPSVPPIRRAKRLALVEAGCAQRGYVH